MKSCRKQVDDESVYVSYDAAHNSATFEVRCKVREWVNYIKGVYGLSKLTSDAVLDRWKDLGEE